MIHLICNAHLDPVWLWRWDEGASEALSTFRAAADFLDAYPTLKFNHNESILYEWIEEYDPKLFSRIVDHVKAGKWEITGGWFLQPDCNMPSGESIVRQALKGQQYFKEMFGKTSNTAINYDSFGHSKGLVQLLAKCGYKQYIICRPDISFYPFENPDFIWKGYDGSEIIVHRSDENYNSIKGKVAEELVVWNDKHKDKNTLFLWGVGNHGGGPSRKDLDDINELISQGVKLSHSTPTDYFSILDKNKLPLYEEGLNPVAEGCYTSQIRIKQQHRRLENDLVMVEKMASHASICGFSTYEKEKINDAWRDLLFAEFHDALPGSAIPSVEEDTLRTLHHGLEITAKLKTKYFFALSAGQDKLIDETVPVLVYNPHSFGVKTPVDCSFVLPKQNWNVEFSIPIVYQNGKKIPSQLVKEESNFNMDWCKCVVFEADLEPSSINRFDVYFEILPARPIPKTQASNNKIIVKTEKSSVEINTITGLIDSYIVNGKEYLKPNSLAIEVFEDTLNSWNGDFHKDTNSPIGKFVPMSPSKATIFRGLKGSVAESVCVIEEGEVRTVVEAIMEYNNSRLCQRYIILNDGSLEIETIVFFAEKEKRLKMSVPSTLENADYIGQTMFGREKLNTRIGETVSQYFTCITNNTHALSIINDSTYGSDYIESGEARITLLRSAGYGASTFLLGEPYHEKMYQPRMEQGERRYRFRLMGGEKENILTNVDSEAALFNQTPYALPYCPSGEGEKPLSLVNIDKQNIVLSCFKQSEKDANIYILRVYESQGKETTFNINVPCLNIKHMDTLKSFEVKTYELSKENIKETTMLEGII